MIYAIARLNKRQSEAIPQIVNIQFPDKAGFTLRYNRLVRVGFTKSLQVENGEQDLSLVL